MRSEGTPEDLGAQVVRQTSDDAQDHHKHHNLCGRGSLIVLQLLFLVPPAELFHIAAIALLPSHGFQKS
jgi:hypothetical protein